MVETLDKHEKGKEFMKAMKKYRSSMKKLKPALSKDDYFKQRNLSGKGRSNKIKRNKMYKEYARKHDQMNRMRESIMKSNVEKMREVIKDVSKDVIEDAVVKEIQESRTTQTPTSTQTSQKVILYTQINVGGEGGTSYRGQDEEYSSESALKSAHPGARKENGEWWLTINK